jgi:hypothetical protein
MKAVKLIVNEQNISLHSYQGPSDAPENETALLSLTVLTQTEGLISEI